MLERSRRKLFAIKSSAMRGFWPINFWKKLWYNTNVGMIRIYRTAERRNYGQVHVLLENDGALRLGA